MFTNLLPDDDQYRVYVSSYAERHYIKRFAKDYPGKQWPITLESIKDELRRIKALERTQQVDELWHKDSYWIFKYDFTIAGSRIAPKNSGNRCVVLLDSNSHRVDILMTFGKGDLPKNMGETQFIKTTLQNEHSDVWAKVR